MFKRTITTHMHRSPNQAAAVAALTEINLDDLITSLGLDRAPTGRGTLRRALRPVARRFAHQVATFDALVGSIGLQAASAWLLGQLVRRVEIQGQASIPRHGPLLLIANHPGLYDTIGLFAAIPRPDLRIIAAERPFLQALPHTSRSLLLIDEATSERMAVVRAAARHLRGGGALLLFPGGTIEPDPAVLPGAIAALGAWSASIDLFGRLVPELTAVSAIVSGVLAQRALDHPLIKLRRTQAERELLAATLQLVFPGLHNRPMRVAFAAPLVRAQFARGSASALGPAVLASSARLIEQAAGESGNRF